MPVMNGFECLAEMKKNKNLDKVPVIIFTTTNEPAAIKKTHSLGATAYLKKPNDYSTLIVKLESLINTDFTQKPQSAFSLSDFSL